MTGIKEEFINEFSSDIYTSIIESAGSNATNNGVSEEQIPNDEVERFVFSILEIIEYETLKENDEYCDIDVTDEELTNFVIANHKKITEIIKELPSRGAIELNGPDLIYPFEELIDIQVEIQSKTKLEKIETHNMVGYDTNDSEIVFVCLVPTNKTPEPNDILEEFSSELKNNNDDEPVEIVVPIDPVVWKISSNISPGFMTLDGWDTRKDEKVKVQLGIVNIDQPNESRLLLTKLTGEWKA